MRQEDIQPVAHEYQRYKELKAMLKNVSSGASGSSGSSGSSAGGSSAGSSSGGVSGVEKRQSYDDRACGWSGIAQKRGVRGCIHVLSGLVLTPHKRSGSSRKLYSQPGV
jgi:hypothetical protein